MYVALALLLLITGFLTMVEMGLFSVRRERLELASHKGDKRGALALRYLDDPPKFLTASNVLLTLLSVMIGSLVQPHLTVPLESVFTGWGLSSDWVAPGAYATAVTLLTVVSLVVANLLPKQLGFVWAEPVSIVFAPLMRVYVALAQPLAIVVEPIVRLITRFLGIPQGAQAKVGEGDLLLLLEEGLRCGGVDPREQEIARRAFALSDLRIDSLMTPRESIEWIEVDLNPSAMKDRIAASKRSWIVVADDSLDRVVGIVQAREYLAKPSPPTKRELLAMVRQPVCVVVGTRLTKALELLSNSTSRVILVQDHDGRITGLTTANDIVTQILGPVKALS